MHICAFFCCLNCTEHLRNSDFCAPSILTMNNFASLQNLCQSVLLFPSLDFKMSGYFRWFLMPFTPTKFSQPWEDKQTHSINDPSPFSCGTFPHIYSSLHTGPSWMI